MLRNSKSRGWIFMLFLVILLLLSAGISLKGCPFQAPSDRALSGWLVDWHWQPGSQDLMRLEAGMNEIQVFGAYFNAQDRPFLSEAADQGLSALQDQKREGQLLFLTIVNDWYQPDGKGIQKDEALLNRLLSSEAGRLAHLQQVLDLIEDYELDGIELDYEKVPSWEDYIAFYTELYHQLQAKDMKLRVVLEPGLDLKRVRLPEGPVYVMMAYNLYGYHSGPGPKADQQLIEGVAKKLDQIPGEAFLALATGGFDWSHDGSIRALTETQALALSAQRTGDLVRDDESKSLYFNYLDENRGEHTVWYADSTTLDYWIQWAQRAGYGKIALWRLGDLSEETLTFLREYQSEIQ